MKAKLIVVLMAGAALTAGSALAQDAKALMETNGCGKCHAADTKKMASSFKDLTAKFAGDKDAVAKITAQLKDGKGHPKVSAPDADIKAMVAAALSYK